MKVHTRIRRWGGVLLVLGATIAAAGCGGSGERGASSGGSIELDTRR